MNALTTAMDGTNAVIVRHGIYQSDHLDYSWLLLALLAVAMIAGGLRKAFWDKTSN